MNMYHLQRKVENGLCSAALLWEPQEFTPAETEPLVAETGKENPMSSACGCSRIPEHKLHICHNAICV
jgi:hypothetical protein